MDTIELDKLIAYAEVRAASLRERLELAKEQNHALNQIAIASELCGTLELVNEAQKIKKQRYE